MNNATHDRTVGSTTNPVSYSPTAGNLVLVFIEARDSTGAASTISAPTDDASGGSSTYTQIFNQTNFQGTAQYNAACFYCASVKSGVTTITGNLSSANCLGAITVIEYSGLSATTPLDQSTAADTSSTGTTATAASLTTTFNNEVIVGMFINFNSGFTYSSSGSYKLRSSVVETGNGLVAGVTDQVVSVKGSYAAAVNISSSATWYAWAVTLTDGIVLTPNSQLGVQQPLAQAIQQRTC